MPTGRVLVISLGLVLTIGFHAAAQSLTPGRPGPFVIDVRGVVSGVPTTIALYPTMVTNTQFAAPSRGFGGDLGGHVYPFGLGPARIGIGANVIVVRGSTRDAQVTVRLVVPQLSFNFGTSNGWSYLSAGVGPARVEASTTFSMQSVNAGGGARWFLNNHAAIGFDIRMHRLDAKGAFPRTTLVSAAVGVSLK